MQVRLRYAHWSKLLTKQKVCLLHFLGTEGTLLSLFFFAIENNALNERNSIAFNLHVRCERGGPRLTGIVFVLHW